MSNRCFSCFPQRCQQASHRCLRAQSRLHINDRRLSRNDREDEGREEKRANFVSLHERGKVSRGGTDEKAQSTITTIEKKGEEG